MLAIGVLEFDAVTLDSVAAYARVAFRLDVELDSGVAQAVGDHAVYHRTVM